jgi:hypothetical protein
LALNLLKESQFGLPDKSATLKKRMPLKFQFQFAGADFSRPSSPHRKWLRIGLVSLMLALAVAVYLEYLHYLLHGPQLALPHFPHLVHSTPAVPPAAAPAATTPASGQPTAPDAPSALPSLKKIADDSLLAAASLVANAVKMIPAIPAVPTVRSEPAAKPVTVATAAPVVARMQKPVTTHPLRVRTEQERLYLAGQTAFANVIELADKYPDAYGFQAQDFLSDAKLGAPIPVYTIEESDRANYRAGQPVKPLLKPARQWVFPVMMGERICCMVEVRQDGHDFIPGTGNRSLGMAWSKIIEKWPAEAGYHPMLLVNSGIPGYYFTVPELPNQNITDTVQMFYFHPDTSPAEVILASWR